MKLLTFLWYSPGKFCHEKTFVTFLEQYNCWLAGLLAGCLVEACPTLLGNGDMKKLQRDPSADDPQPKIWDEIENKRN